MTPGELSFPVAGGRRIAARDWNPGGQRRILALHGWLDNAATFDLLAPLLDDARIVAPDFAGHGLSDPRPAGTRYHFIDHLDDVLSVVDQLGWDEFVLMGHSMGAGIATLFAAALPERVSRLVLIEGFGPYTGQGERPAAVLRQAMSQWRDFEDRTRIMASRELAIRARMQGLVPVSEAAAAILCDRGVGTVEGGFVWRADKRLRLDTPWRVTEEQVLDFIRDIRAPTLLIEAENSLPFARAVFAKRCEAHPDLRHVLLPGGHHLHLDGDVAAVAATIRDFLSSP